MQILVVALLAFVPTLEMEDSVSIETDFTTTEISAEEDASVVLSAGIEALSAAIESEDAEAIEAAATRLLEITDQVEQVVPENGRSFARIALSSMRGWAFWQLGRVAEADAAFQMSGTLMAAEYGYLSLRHDYAAEQEDWQKVLEMLEADAQVGESPEDMIINYYSLDNLRFIRAQFDDEDEANSRVAEVLILADWGADLPPGERDWIYLFAMQGRHRAGDESGARDALALIRTPSYLSDILFDPEYAVYHPYIEETHGADLSGAAASIGAELAAGWDTHREEADYLLQYLIHLRSIGRSEEIAARYGPIVDDLERAIARGETDHFLMNSDGFFIVNYLAGAEMRLGGYDRPIARMDAILTLGLEDHSALVNQAINRLNMLFQNGDYASGLEAARSLEQVEGGIVAPYGQMLIRSAAACAAHQSGDPVEARIWLDRLLAMDDPSALALLETYLCMDEMEAAEAQVITELQGENSSSMLIFFYDFRLWQPMGDFDRLLETRKAVLINRPAVMHAIEEAGGIRSLNLASLGG